MEYRDAVGLVAWQLFDARAESAGRQKSLHRLDTVNRCWDGVVLSQRGMLIEQRDAFTDI